MKNSQFFTLLAAVFAAPHIGGKCSVSTAGVALVIAALMLLGEILT